MNARTLAAVAVLSSLVVVGAVSCGSACPVGRESCACTTGGGCDPGLTCLSSYCVRAGGGAGGGVAGGAGGGVAGGAGGGVAGGAGGGVAGGAGGGVAGGTGGGSGGGGTGGGGAGGGATCPTDMVRVPSSTACIDKYEASRPDATASSRGSNATGVPRSVAGVIPWYMINYADAAAACVRAGKRMCTSAEWQTACEGGTAKTYPYGQSFDAQKCLIIPNNSWTGPRPAPTGALSQCEGGVPGLFDLGGNAAEWTSDLTSTGSCTHCRTIRLPMHLSQMGNATCAAAAPLSPIADAENTGFRCCKDP